MNNKKSLFIHYYRSDSEYENWNLWIWEIPQRKGKEFNFSGRDNFGAFVEIPLDIFSENFMFNKLGFLIKTNGSWNKKDGDDKVISLYKSFSHSDNDFHIYLKENDNNLYKNELLERIDTFEFANFDSFKTAEIKTNDFFSSFLVKENGKIILEQKLNSPVKSLNIDFEKEITLDHEYVIEIKVDRTNTFVKKNISFTSLYKTERFLDLYNYDGELGAIVGDDFTTFKVWSPVSKRVVLKVYKTGTPSYVKHETASDETIFEIQMEKGKNGVFEAKIPGNLHGFYYNYVVSNDFYQDKEIVDIYAKSAGINGLRGMIVDFRKISNNSDDLNILTYSSNKLTVYETHVADLTSSPTWTSDNEKRRFEKTFVGACLEDTFYSENGKTVKTGFDHIKELGVNAVQFLPIFDQANNELNMTFNWGYNPLNFNVLEGGYSTNPFDGLTRIVEFKNLVKKYNEAGITIIMDVVFNHVYKAEESNFDVLMPGYYFRYNHDGSLSNGSGCGNETASDMPMMRKFMIDSVTFWAKEYKLGGFRFDLMGLHDIETMNKLSEELHKINQNIVIYGEPWTGGNSMLPHDKAAIKDNVNKFKGYGFFNDNLRDALLRESSNRAYTGWCSNSFSDSVRDQENIANAIKGCSFSVLDPNQLLNYASCHDNRTLYDKIKHNGVDDEKEIKRIALLANSIVLTSNGIAFILSGEEFLRSKGGCENSYNASYEVNALDYSLKLKNFDVFRQFQKLIKLKQTISGLSLNNDENTLLKIDSSKPNIISYELEDKDNSRKYIVYHLNGYKTGKPCIVNLEGYNLYLDSINPNKELSSSTSLIAYETLVAFKQK